MHPPPPTNRALYMNSVHIHTSLFNEIKPSTDPGVFEPIFNLSHGSHQRTVFRVKAV